MITFPNAKINLGLDILRRREDGYHDIETVMVPVPWHDVLEIVPAKGGGDHSDRERSACGVSSREKSRHEGLSRS